MSPLIVQSGKILQDWKTVDAPAIFKKGSMPKPGNDRPVSLTCVTCKVIECFVRDAIVAHLTENKLYTECQHRFRKKERSV